ncbi:MAG TPA: metalloregulator ArsR/SmtB family transcription factor [Polyangiaceae bacterium]|jgi:DNA-binding transcriptional ArsR family regulator|nr:metalloregulator ArsR/SmtB family transcription factor [Polyangiaceae bacterium]
MSIAKETKRDERLDAIFHALSDATRRRIIAELARGSQAVTELALPFPISLPAISKHLDVLERAGLVRRAREGRFQRCHLTAAALDDASAFIERYRAYWHTNLDQLAAFVEASATPARAKKAKK